MLHHLVRNHNLILGSASPRRQQLLQEISLTFSVQTADIDESAPNNLSGIETAKYIAKQKANALQFLLRPNDILITADTEVWQNNIRFGKPADLAEAKKMLNQLSGISHQVISGVCFTTNHRQHCFSAITEVFFKPLTNSEIDYYCTHGNPLDKAGAYGIQEWIGYVAVQRIVGSYTNVVGLPVSEFYAELEKFITQI